jgi:lactoylglutathione lyase
MASAAPADWLQQDKRRMLHVVYRVGDMQKAIDFYKTLGMDLLRFRDIPEGKYSNAFLGYASEETNFCLELTFNYGWWRFLGVFRGLLMASCCCMDCCMAAPAGQ